MCTSFGLSLCRFITLVARSGWRSNILSFPSECGDWTGKAEGGCSRVVLQKNGCVSTDSVTSRNLGIVFDNPV